MAKRVNGLKIEAEYTEWAVETTTSEGEPLVYQAESEADARFVRGVMGGRLLVRHVLETPWADAPNN